MNDSSSSPKRYLGMPDPGFDLDRYPRGGDQATMEEIARRALAHGPRPSNALRFWNKPEYLSCVWSDEGWKRALRKVYVRQRASITHPFPHELLPEEPRQQVFFLVISHDFRRLTQVDPDGETSLFWQGKFESKKLNELFEELLRMFQKAVENHSDTSHGVAVMAHLLQFPESFFLNRRSSHPEILERYFEHRQEHDASSRSPLPASVQKLSSEQCPIWFGGSRQGIRDYVEEREEQIWIHLNQLRCHESLGEVFLSLAKLNLPALLKRVSPLEFLTHAGATRREVQYLLNDIAQARDPKIINALRQTTIGWKLYLADVFSEHHSPLPQETFELFKELLEPLPRQLLGTQLAEKLELSTSQDALPAWFEQKKPEEKYQRLEWLSPLIEDSLQTLKCISSQHPHKEMLADFACYLHRLMKEPSFDPNWGQRYQILNVFEKLASLKVTNEDTVLDQIRPLLQGLRITDKELNHSLYESYFQSRHRARTSYRYEPLAHKPQHLFWCLDCNEWLDNRKHGQAHNRPLCTYCYMGR